MPALPLAVGLLLLPGPSIAADSSFDAASSVLQMLLGLALVIGLLFAALHVLRRLSGGKGLAAGVLKIRGATAVGPRERVVLLEVADKVLVLGVAPGRISTLHTLDASQLPTGTAPQTLPGNNDFQAWLKRTLERRTR